MEGGNQLEAPSSAQLQLRPPSTAAKISFSPPKAAKYSTLQKGKAKLLESTAITYRHLLNSGGNSSTMNPLRTVAHIDIDAAYASIEMSRLGMSTSTPLAVQQWNGLIAVNYAARAFGITRHETPADAKIKCPELVLVHVATYAQGDTEPQYHTGDDVKPETHKASLDTYRRESLKIIKIFQEFCPLVEKASIDESYLDLSSLVKSTILELYPELARVPPGKTIDSELPSPDELGVQVDWNLLGNVIPSKNPSPSLEPVDGEASGSRSMSPAIEEEEVEEDPLTWPDLALSIGAEIVNRCRKAVEDRLGYTCSAGIAPNKMLAKLGSGEKKPNAQTILRLCAVPAFLNPMKFQKIRNLGGKFGETVKTETNSELVSDLLQYSLTDLQTKFGEENGEFVWSIVRGLNFTEVEAKVQVKSMLSSKNFRPSINTWKECHHWLNILATELHLRLKESREESPGLWPKTITFSHRSVTFVSKSHQVAFPYTSTLSIGYILKIAEKLLLSALPAIRGSTPSLKNLESGIVKVGPYSNVQLSFSGIEKIEQGQKGIERFFDGSVVKKREVEKRKFGMEEMDPDALQIGGDSRKNSIVDGSRKSSPPMVKKKKLEPIPTFACARCAEPVALAASTYYNLLESGDDAASVAIKVEELERRENESHTDWHYARDIVESDRSKHLSNGQKQYEKKAKKKTATAKVEQKNKVGSQTNLKGFFKK